MILIGDLTLWWLALVTTIFVFAYHKVAPWWKSEWGVHLMTFALCFAVTGWYLVSAIFTRNAEPSQAAARIYIYSTFASLFTWRLVILTKAQCPWVANKLARFSWKRDKKEQ